MSATYPNPIDSIQKYNLGEHFIFHANPQLKALQVGDIVNVRFGDDSGWLLGQARVTEEVGPNTYRARRTE